MNKSKSILAHLQRGESISGVGALELYGLYRLSSVIHSLRKQGYKIETRDVKTVNGNYGEYYILGD